ncbi:hypothetical protein LINGRAHAP2_LOCUS32254 [Linum grandiflorum]
MKMLKPDDLNMEISALSFRNPCVVASKLFCRRICFPSLGTSQLRAIESWTKTELRRTDLVSPAGAIKSWTKTESPRSDMVSPPCDTSS